MRVKSTPHAHTTFVDGRSTVEEMAAEAFRRGFISLGFSEHASQPFDKNYCLDARSEKDYQASVRNAQSAYAGRMPVALGIERDLFSTAERAQYQYVIGSVHYLPLSGEYIAVDGDLTGVVRLWREGFLQDGLKMARAYYERLAEYVKSYRPDIIGHADLITKHNQGNRFFDEGDGRYLNIAREALECMAESGAMLEVNTGAMARGSMSRPYPQIELLRFWREKKGRVILSSDCHDAAKIDFGYDMAYKCVEAAGFQSVWALSAKEGGPLFEEFALLE